jgi:hypothetical protein
LIGEGPSEAQTGAVLKRASEILDGVA